MPLALALVLVLVAAAPAAAAPERLSPAGGDRHCRKHSGMCLGAHDLAHAGGLLAWPFDARRNDVRIVALPWGAGRRGVPVTVARERGVQRVAVGAVAATPLPDGHVLVAWDREEMEGVEDPIRVRIRRVAPDGTPAGEAVELARVGQHGDEPGLEGDSVIVAPQLVTAARGAVLAGWLTAGTRRTGDRVGVVAPLAASGAASGPALAVSDRRADDFALTAAFGGAVATWTRARGTRIEIRARRLHADGRPDGGAVTIGRLRAHDDWWWTVPAFAGTGDALLMAVARRTGAGLRLETQILGVGLTAAAPPAVVARIGMRRTVGAGVQAFPAPGGGWLVASAGYRDHRGDYEFPPAHVHAIRLDPSGRPAGSLRTVARDGYWQGTALAWDPDGGALAWLAAPRGSNFARVHASAF